MTFWYLASPYAKYIGGHEAAFALAAENAALLLRARIPVFCPIAHSHPIAVHGGIDGNGQSFWVEFVDKPFIDAAYGMILLTATGWDSSQGIAYEIKEFERTGRPIVRMEPYNVPLELAVWDYEKHS